MRQTPSVWRMVANVATRASNAGTALKSAVSLWFLTAVAGQWAFVYYIAAFYGPTLVSGEFELWDRNRSMTDGYLAGDVVGNLFFAAHVLLAAVLTFGGALQLIPRIRQRALAFHRWNGRIFMIAAFAAGLDGLYLEWVRGTGLRAPTGLPSAVSITLNATLIITFAALAWRAVRSKDIAAHQRWAIRLFLVVNGTWFMRVGMRAWIVLTGGAFDGLDFSASGRSPPTCFRWRCTSCTCERRRPPHRPNMHWQQAWSG